MRILFSKDRKDKKDSNKRKKERPGQRVPESSSEHHAAVLQLGGQGAGRAMGGEQRLSDSSLKNTHSTTRYLFLLKFVWLPEVNGRVGVENQPLSPSNGISGRIRLSLFVFPVSFI